MSFMQLIANTRAGNAHSKQGVTTATRQALVTAHEHVIFVRRNAHLFEPHRCPTFHPPYHTCLQLRALET